MSQVVRSAPPQTDREFEQDVVRGLSAKQKSISCRWFYDTRGSELFEKITALPEYYLTREEIALLRARAREIAYYVSGNATVVEFGSGSSRKTPLLLKALDATQAYVPVDIAAEFLMQSCRGLSGMFPKLAIRPVVADLMVPEANRLIGRALSARGPRLGLFLGSSIGNYTYVEAQALLRRFADLLGPDAWLLIGVDSTREVKTLLPAYNDAQGITAAFNKNVLARINRELGANFDLSAFEHAGWLYPDRDRIEMHLVSQTRQQVQLAGRCFHFTQGETIHTENCHKYSADQFENMASVAGWRAVRHWVGAESGYGMYLLCRQS